MKILFIGGTGKISSAVSRQVIELGHELYLLNRGRQAQNPPGSRSLKADVNQPKAARAALRDLQFDVVVDWIGFIPADVERTPAGATSPAASATGVSPLPPSPITTPL